ncbi:MAG: trigger factor [bacterium]
MQVTKKDLGKSQFELTVELTVEEIKPFMERATESISASLKIEGFRPGKAPYEMVKQKVGELAILEEATRFAVNKHLDKVLLDNLERQAVGQPMISITKLVPGNPVEFKVEISTMPEVTLGNYKEFALKEPVVEISEAELQKVMTELVEMRAIEKISEEVVTETDKVILDIQMYLDKVPVEGGQGKGVAVILGKNYIIPGFDEKIVGMKKAEVREFNLHYPEDNHQKNLAGKMVDFKVTLVEVYKREMPGLDDAFAITFGLKNYEELQKNISENLRHEKIEKEAQKIEIELLNKISETTKFGDIPEVVIKNEAEQMFHELEHNIEHQGGNINDYLQNVKKSKEEIQLDMLPEAVKRVKTILVIREIGIKEGIKVEANEVEEYLAKAIEQYKDDKEVLERVKTISYKNYLFNFLTNQKIIKQLKDWNLVK